MLVALNRQLCSIHKSGVTLLEYTKSTVAFYTGVQCLILTLNRQQQSLQD